ncbi:hypothetical protein [Teredinibacter turnerae]|uniref:hypothetical protein n=1 Tax=Teredinibacter turnerae TaxID=2426 RepID=UPI0012BBDF7E|nr:hypothetical protein [Teredinibacter turnerae]
MELLGKIFNSKITQYLVYLFLLAASVGPILPFENIQYAALTAAVIALVVRFDHLYSLVEKLDKRATKEFANFDAAEDFIKHHIKQEIKNKSDVNIKWIGSSMHFATPMIENKLIPLFENSSSKLSIEIVMLSKEWDKLAEYNKIWPEQLQRYGSELGKLADNHPELVSSMDIFVYQQIPHLTGGLINEKHLIIAYCEWDEKGQYHVGPRQQYFYYKPNGPDTFAKTEQFKRWLARLKEQKIYPA